MDWDSPIYVAERGQVRGPIVLRELRREYDEDMLSAETLFCRKASEGWISWEDLVAKVSLDFPEFLQSQSTIHKSPIAAPPIPPRFQAGSANSSGRSSAVTALIVVGAVLGGLGVLGFGLAVLLVVIGDTASKSSAAGSSSPSGVEDTFYEPAAQQELPFNVEAGYVNENNPVLGRMLVVVCRSERPITITGITINGDPIPPENLAKLSVPRDIGSMMLGLPDIAQLNLPYRMSIGAQVNIQIPPKTGHLIFVDFATDRGPVRYEFQ